MDDLVRDRETSGEARYFWKTPRTAGSKACGSDRQTHMPDLWESAFREVLDGSWGLLQVQAAGPLVFRVPTTEEACHR
ncbi:hypothetical protein F511_47700 [Dorcoceras hygrometricum]|uniref:Uncharacterized protein n=1 Tax=Dorcoceras hygrometricum TaxID=472368 RepID=A0A2Z6ZQF8_9LAMI|nr:hypothetical protein F511_47700 [Dorcoceras hygrometricum]